MNTYTTILSSQKLTEVSTKSTYKDVKALMYVLRQLPATLTVMNQETGKGFWAISGKEGIIVEKVEGMSRSEHAAHMVKVQAAYEDEMADRRECGMTEKKQVFINVYRPSLFEMAHRAGHEISFSGRIDGYNAVKLDGIRMKASAARTWLLERYHFYTHCGKPCL